MGALTDGVAEGGDLRRRRAGARRDPAGEERAAARIAVVEDVQEIVSSLAREGRGTRDDGDVAVAAPEVRTSGAAALESCAWTTLFCDTPFPPVSADLGEDGRRGRYSRFSSAPTRSLQGDRHASESATGPGSGTRAGLRGMLDPAVHQPRDPALPPNRQRKADLRCGEGRKGKRPRRHSPLEHAVANPLLAAL